MIYFPKPVSTFPDHALMPSRFGLGGLAARLVEIESWERRVSALEAEAKADREKAASIRKDAETRWQRAFG